MTAVRAVNMGGVASAPVQPTSIKRRANDTRLNLSSNELIHPRMDEILAGVAARLTPESFRRYPVAADAIDSIAGHLGCRADEFVLTPGSDVALRAICGYFARSTSGQGHVILQEPNYVAWEQTAALFGLTVRRMPRTSHDIRRDDQTRRILAEASASTGNLIAVSVPNGPAGGCLSEPDLDELATVARQRDHLLVIDSCYQVFNGPLTAQLDRGGGPVLVVQSLSKSHGLAGARIAVLSGAPRLLADLPAEPLEHAVTSVSLLAAVVASEHHESLGQIWQEIREVRERTALTLRGWGLHPAPTGGNFLTVKVGSGARAASVTSALAQNGFRVRDLSGLPGLDGCLRFTVADEPTTGTFLSALDRVLHDSRSTTPGEAI